MNPPAILPIAQADGLGRSPRIVDLVRSLTDGRHYLRAQHEGRFWWQALPGSPGEEVADSGAWSASAEYLGHYWSPLGRLRLARGVYRPIEELQRTELPLAS